ncbi:MAG: sugar porter family MFS transporter [Francisella sp.]
MKETNKLKLFFIVLFSAMGGMLYGYDIGIIGGSLPFIQISFNMTPNQVSLLGGSVLFGGAFAILICGFLADLFGRKNMIITSGLLFVISVFMIYFSQNYEFLLFSRLLQGVAVGFISITVPLYLTESVPSKIRGLAVTSFQLFLTAGILLAVAVSLLFISKDPVTGVEVGNWRNMFLTALIPGFIVFIGGFFLIKSPRWLIMKDKEAEAEQVLVSIIGTEAAKQQIQVARSLIEQSKSEGSLLSNLTKKHYLKPIILVFAIAMLAQMTGINSILQYAPVMLKKAGLGSVYASIIGGVAITGINFLTTIIAVIIADKVERKIIVGFGTLMVALVLLTLSFIIYDMPDSSTQGMILLIGLILYIFFFAIGSGAYIWVILSELLPTAIRSKGLAVALFLNSLTSALLASAVMPITKIFDGYFAILGICGMCTLLYSFIVFKFVPRTSGRSLEEIEQEFMK